MAKIFDESRPAMTQIRELEVGESVLFPNKRALSIRANISIYQKALGRKWAIKSLQNEDWFEVTRTE